MEMKHILILLLSVSFTLPAFAQITQEPLTQVIEIQKELKASHTYTWQPFVVMGTAIPLVWEIKKENAPVPTSFRMQVGVVKKMGMYVAGITNFRFAQPNGDYDEGYDDYKWTGKKHYNRWSLLAGLIIRPFPKFMVYWGGGFGKSVLLHETEDGQWMWSNHQDIFGGLTVDAEFGFIYHVKYFVISAGFSTSTIVSQWYSTGNIGLGAIF